MKLILGGVLTCAAVVMFKPETLVVDGMTIAIAGVVVLALVVIVGFVSTLGR